MKIIITSLNARHVAERRVKKGVGSSMAKQGGYSNEKSGLGKEIWAPGGSDSEEPPTQSRILEGESRDKKTTKTGVWVPPQTIFAELEKWLSPVLLFFNRKRLVDDRELLGTDSGEDPRRRRQRQTMFMELMHFFSDDRTPCRGASGRE